ncbi:hypothetical protein BTVI_62540 [Pitangus sulphuratus]|nr:hypothetical protein BTVI_62540 [Pitangus sulphuratus]
MVQNWEELLTHSKAERPCRDTLENWRAGQSLTMKFSKDKFQDLYHRQGNPRCTYRLENKRLESSPTERDLGVLLDGKLNISQQCLGSQQGQLCPGGHQAKHHQLVEGGVCPALLCTGVASPGMSCAVLGNLSIKKDTKLLESVQRRVMKMVKGLEGKPYKEWLRSLGLFSLQKRKLRGGLIAVYTFLTNGIREAGTDLFSAVTSDRTRGNAMKLCQGLSCKVGKSFSPRGWLGTESDSSGKWSKHQA